MVLFEQDHELSEMYLLSREDWGLGRYDDQDERLSIPQKADSEYRCQLQTNQANQERGSECQSLRDHRDQNIRKRWFSSGWRSSVACGAVIAAIVFCLNLSVAMYVRLRAGYPSRYPNTIFSGGCDIAKQLNTHVHLAINVLSTLLLSTSNYAMQCVTGPTRHEIDVAHANKQWLDIGVLSVRNLRSISRGRLVLWLVLGFSSLPLHLL